MDSTARLDTSQLRSVLQDAAQRRVNDKQALMCHVADSPDWLADWLASFLASQLNVKLYDVLVCKINVARPPIAHWHICDMLARQLAGPPARQLAGPPTHLTAARC